MMPLKHFGDAPIQNGPQKYSISTQNNGFQSYVFQVMKIKFINLSTGTRAN